MTKPETEQPYASNQDQKANSRLWVCSVGLASLWYIGMLKEKSTPQYTSWTPENSPFWGRKSLEKKYKCNPDCQIFHILIRNLTISWSFSGWIINDRVHLSTELQVRLRCLYPLYSIQLQTVFSELCTYFYRCTIANSENAVPNDSLGIMGFNIYNCLVFFILTIISAMSKRKIEWKKLENLSADKEHWNRHNSIYE